MTPASVDPRLVQHLRHQLGAWPPPAPFTVAGSAARAAPGWDGEVHPVSLVSSPDGLVIGVPPAAVDAVRGLGDGWQSPGYADALTVALGLTGPHALHAGGVFRWTTEPTDLEPLGEWVETDDPRLPDWLRPFNGGVLVAWEDDGSYVAGVGLKAHDAWVDEISVGTEPAARGRGLARRLVVTAAREVLARNHIPTYLHAPDNTASAHVAEGAGFPDRGWHVGALWPVAGA